MWRRKGWDWTYFNPPAPCGAGPADQLTEGCGMDNFNPPAPCGAGPLHHYECHIFGKFQSTRPVRGGTIVPTAKSYSALISIHPPRAGRDGQASGGAAKNEYFNPPAPCGAGPEADAGARREHRISIHPPRAGRDGAQAAKEVFTENFNPPAPCGAGPGTMIWQVSARKFQSTRPVRGGTLATIICSRRIFYFNPPAPCGAGQ